MTIVQRFAEAFNRGDVEALLGCFTDDATYRDLFYGPHAGRPALRAMFQRMFHEGQDYRWTMEAVVVEGARAAAEWSFAYTVTEAIPRSAGRPVRFSGMSLFELAGDGRIRAYREYADTGVALLQLGFTPAGLAKVLARRLPESAAAGR